MGLASFNRVRREQAELKAKEDAKKEKKGKKTKGAK